jgi:hypothetical protein
MVVCVYSEYVDVFHFFPLNVFWRDIPLSGSRGGNRRRG